MLLAKVTGNVVATQKDATLVGYKLLLITYVDLEGNFIGECDTVVIDLVGAGIGDTVLVVDEGDAVQQILGHCNSPVNKMIIGVVDNYQVEKVE
ncbi:MAG TPA: EutN/CcmL family microcompartment protein [Ignavibacteriales bacterium]|nr:EutN/CcmL family microcompartment protein [Ignavibacteriales bacterium]HOL80491.1 EutN/CcmL family microcompartment protein [Ignavibacteriales bacterium]HOM64942.1 EutN/CcmL family microcompartment protein [Ignavibacteriales bacterium]HPD67963.1 EutN/CcmL family microcompartment protein [Ignavibacteriales bacterium]HPP34218.1 EutN/CcmL family microcompartment protein [Ignavibacteriales bacterium]